MISNILERVILCFKKKKLRFVTIKEITGIQTDDFTNWQDNYSTVSLAILSQDLTKLASANS